MAFPTNNELEQLVAPVAQAYAMDIEHIRTVKAGKKSQVVIALDSDTHPTLDELEEVSNELSTLFDALEQRGEVNFGAGYTLELTTPGVDMPLTLPRHWRRNRGRLVNAAGQLYRVGALNQDETEVVVIPAGAKTPVAHPMPVSELAGAVVEIEFKKPPAAEVELAEQDFEEVTSEY
ncbi:ribosome maturation factor RimP [Corynebacterium riegelii]|uniref:ribosome maturation factor RimP n=1 Tax=Corynebacterium riegelii TaxID=156976 RepID=UPI000C7634EB|nr:ribosome maturation factor RimP [Corynebacterium riegelii]PLA13017.1 ribosome maturation factor RimP [Corynebacterium riegelii]